MGFYIVGQWIGNWQVREMYVSIPYLIYFRIALISLPDGPTESVTSLEWFPT